MLRSLSFQDQAISQLRRVVLDLWLRDQGRQMIVFKAPTGSGKTVMMAELVKRLVYDKEWNQDTAFIWISFSPESAQQSKQKFGEYYDGVGDLQLLDLEILRQKEMHRGDVLFVNWQKLKSRSVEARKARNDQPEQYRLSFDNLLANTHKAGRQVILLIDEAHIQAGDHLVLTQEILDLIDPKIILHITATPDEKTELEAYRNNSLVEVKRSEVIQAGLIKESLVVMPEEEIDKVLQTKQAEGQKLDLDELLLELAMEKKEELVAAYQEIGENINPLILIQLPNADQIGKDLQAESKENFVRRYLQSKGVPDAHIATWLSGKKENLEGLTNNYSHIDFLIFKEAPATGWDCPRASILVMYRDIKKDSFRTQIIGRILRMPQGKHYETKPELNSGYIYTNYQRQEIKDIPSSSQNQVKTKLSRFQPNLTNIKLQSVYFQRSDYNDLGDDFQSIFLQTTNDYFGLTGNLEESFENQAEAKLQAKGLELTNFNNLEINMIVSAKISDFDYFNQELKKKGEDKNYQLSGYDLKKLFDLLCYQVISQQEEESKKYAPARSWEVLKTALKVWLRQNLPQRAGDWYKIVCHDLLKEDSVLKKVIGQSLENYRPKHLQKIQDRKAREKIVDADWQIPLARAYTSDYLEYEPQPKLSAHQPFLLPEKYPGRDNETKFIHFLEEQETIEWWYKNGDQGREHFAVSYQNSQTGEEEPFYVDWIIKFKNGDLVGLYDTKKGLTAKEGEVKDKAEWLQKYIQEENDNSEGLHKFQGGIVIHRGTWKVQDKPTYNYDSNNLVESGWRDLEF